MLRQPLSQGNETAAWLEQNTACLVGTQPAIDSVVVDHTAIELTRLTFRRGVVFVVLSRDAPVRIDCLNLHRAPFLTSDSLVRSFSTSTVCPLLPRTVVNTFTP